MTPRQQKAAHAFVACALSLPAYARVCSIMALESVLNLLEERRGDAVRDPGRYFVSIFGSPAGETWGWRLEGHHVVLNYAVVGQELVSATPLFLGANPAEVRHGAAPVLRPCGEEEDIARELVTSLDPAQRDAAVISAQAPPDFVLTNVGVVPEACLPGEAAPLPFLPRFDGLSDSQKQALKYDRSSPKGLAAAHMTPSQRENLAALVAVYLDRLPEPLAALERDRVDLHDIHFAWAGGLERREGHYYRLQGTSFLVEYDNTQDGANHVHAVWRDSLRDFGLDPLRSHSSQSHGQP
jgi:hypothetical protein